jgi:hypothetical protein
VKVARIVNILHLFFVDDVLIMTRENLQEWKEIAGILETFVSATGLEINIAKSSFHFAGIDENSLAPFRDLFPYNFFTLDVGFRYLGYFLKSSFYKSEDWRWLIQKFERRIDHWCNHWLTLGGRFVLIKAVLESQPVFWMTLAAVPNSVLVKIRQLIFSFLWSGCSERKHMHLCNWETIAKPKKVGGWGLRNLFLFNKALAANTLWRVLTKAGVWHNVIKDKYLPYISVATWFRSVSRSQGSASPIWKNLLKALPIIDHWLCWRPGSGLAIQVGRDCILGLGRQSILSSDLIYALKQQGITFLYQALNIARSDHLSSYWKEGSTLGLSGDLAKEWDDYQSVLSWGGYTVTGQRG